MGGGEIRGRDRSPALEIAVVIGTRPEAIKMAPVIPALRKRGIHVRLVVTGQHTDHAMMGSFLERFGLAADHRLDRRSGDLFDGLAGILLGLGEILRRHPAALVLAVGDTTTVLAAALAARK